MKALFTILVLAAIVFVYVISSSFYVQGELVLAYSLMLSAIASFVFWVKSINLTKAVAKA
ncbi:hypothetical protein [Puia dinghuensis]|uniref:Uncharacterized protein n=1 Tax=Puia dinghuensis TaxID=1792502 RepID=A0A8J2XQK6_9BACT|nr:hypothetical protein [Puia dinghuensis]GGA85406.1 hypothetical protein GCM10011511_05560 [Puia dinghuensis]